MILASMVSVVPEISVGSLVRSDRCAFGTDAHQSAGLDLICLTISEREGVCRFADTNTILLEIPAAFEKELAGLLRECGERLKGKRLVFDLGGVAAISSRQLGILLLVRRVWASTGTLVLRGVSTGIRRILQKARLIDWFEIEPVAAHN
jgi:anti-anti-sigma factor